MESNIDTANDEVQIRHVCIAREGVLAWRSVHVRTRDILVVACYNLRVQVDKVVSCIWWSESELLFRILIVEEHHGSWCGKGRHTKEPTRLWYSLVRKLCKHIAYFPRSTAGAAVVNGDRLQ